MKQLALVAAAITAATIGLSASPASASTGTNVVEGTTRPPVSVTLSDGVTVADQTLCTVYLVSTWNTPNYYAAAKVVNSATSAYTASGWTVGCFGWLERSTNGGASWDVISGVHDEANGQSVQTYNYWDGSGYLARACGYQYLYFNNGYGDVGAGDGPTYCTGSW
jgi:hypothetical protein